MSDPAEERNKEHWDRKKEESRKGTKAVGRMSKNAVPVAETAGRKTISKQTKQVA